MQDLEFKTYHDLNDYLSRFISIGKGVEGKCYLIDGKWVLKKFHIGSDMAKIIYKGDILQFRDIEIEHIVFARYAVYVYGKQAAVIIPYMKGASIKNFPLSWEDISKVAWASHNLVASVNELTNQGIAAVDVVQENIIYKNKRLGITDTTRFYKSNNEKLEKENMENIMRPVIISAFDGSWGYITQFLYMIKSLYKDYIWDIDLLSNPRELLLGVKAELEEFLQMPIEIFRDANEPLRRILEK